MQGSLFEPFGLDMLLVFGLLSGALSLFCFLPYMVDTLRGRTQPQRASWLIWSVLGSISFFSNIDEGASSSLWFVGVQVGSTILICMMSVWLGSGSYLSRKNKIFFGIAALGMIAWYFAQTSVYALGISIAISFVGGLATVDKAYREPDSETLITWVLGMFAASFAALSVGVWNVILLAYPMYLLMLYAAITASVLLGRRAAAKRPVEPAFDIVQFQEKAVFLYTPLSLPEAILAPEGDIFDEINQLPPEEYVQVPVVDKQIH